MGALDFLVRVTRSAKVEFIYNNGYHVNIKMAPYEAFYGHRCHTLVC